MNNATRTPERSHFLASVAVTAIEGGIGYWSVADEYRFAFPAWGDAPHPDAPEGHAYVRFLIEETETTPGLKAEVTVDTIDEGFRRVREAKVTGPDPSPFRSGDATTIKYLSGAVRTMLLDAEDALDGGRIDSSLADILVQVALFGEVRYG